MGRATHVFVNWDLSTGRRLICQLDGPMRPRLCLATTAARAASLETTRSAVNHQKGDSETVIQGVLNGDSGPNASFPITLTGWSGDWKVASMGAPSNGWLVVKANTQRLVVKT